MQVVGFDQLDRPIVSKPTGLEQLDYDEFLRHRYLGVHAGAPGTHLLGGSNDITFGSDGGEIVERWKRVSKIIDRRKHWLWREVYREIGRTCEHLFLPAHIREEITRIYGNLRRQGEIGGKHRSLEETLAKITWLACLIHQSPRSRQNIERGLKEICGVGIGKIPEEFVKAANFRRIRFGIAHRKRNKTYLSQWKIINGERIDYHRLGRL